MHKTEKVTALYEKYFLEQAKLANRDIVSIYTALLVKAKTRELGKRLLLELCFFEVFGVRVIDFERVGSILAKITERSLSKADLYPARENMWISEADNAAVNQF